MIKYQEVVDYIDSTIEELEKLEYRTEELASVYSELCEIQTFLIGKNLNSADYSISRLNKHCISGVGNDLRKAREERRESLFEVSRATYISSQSLSQYETGNTDIPQDKLIRVLDYLGAELPDELIEKLRLPQNVTTGEFLRYHRLCNRVNIKDIANKLDITVEHYRNVEADEIDLSLSELQSLSEILGIQADELIQTTTIYKEANRLILQSVNDTLNKLLQKAIMLCNYALFLRVRDSENMSLQLSFNLEGLL